MELTPNMQLDPTAFMKLDPLPGPDPFADAIPIARPPSPPPFEMPVFPFPFPVPAPVEVDPRAQLNDLLAGGLQNPDGSINLDTLEAMRGLVSQIVPSKVAPHDGPLMDPNDAIMMHGLDAYGIGGARHTDHLGMPVLGPGGPELMPPEMADLIGLHALKAFAESFSAPMPGNPDMVMPPFDIAFVVTEEINKRIADHLGTPTVAFMPYPTPAPSLGYGVPPQAPGAPVAPPVPPAPIMV